MIIKESEHYLEIFKTQKDKNDLVLASRLFLTSYLVSLSLIRYIVP